MKVVRDPKVGAPKVISARRGFLTGPNGEGIAVKSQTARAFPADDRGRAAKAFVAEHRALFGHGPEALAAARITRDYTDAHNGLNTIVWQQQLDGIPVFEATFKAHTTKRGELVNVASGFVPDPATAAGRNVGARATLIAKPKISAAQAISIAADGVGDQVAPERIAAVAAPAGADRHQKFKAQKIHGTEARLVWLPMDASTLRLCWQVVFSSGSRGEMFLVLVDAETGETLVRNGLTNYISNATYNVYTGDSPAPFSPGHATPQSTQPVEVARTLVTISALNVTASPNGWIDDGGTQTLGNNVEAHTDLNADDAPDLPRPTSATRVFDFPLNLADPPSAYRNAAVTDLFYWNNVIHDRLYQLGFTESAGNFQTNNFGRGGNGNDAVQADAQDGSGTNNANFSTPPDGSPGRMQMYTFSGPNPDRDGDFDHEIVIHEYCHGLSNRLVGGGVGISQLATKGMGEGWSDFYPLALLSEAGDDPNGTYAAGAYATFLLAGLNENYYYGIRRYPYSTDLSKNPLTFKDIDPSQASPHTGIPRSPIIANTADEVHNLGEVWCVTLWEARANLIAAHGFAGNEIMLQLVTDGMKLAPANPNFLEARDAIIQADLVANGGANYDRLWAAFAKRGMGDTATSPSSDTTTGVVESFDLPDDLEITSSTAFSSRGPVGGPFNPVSTTYTLRNRGSVSINWTAAKTQPWVTLSATAGTLAPAASTSVTVSVNANANGLPMGLQTDMVSFTNTTSSAVRTRSVILAVGLEFFTEQFTGGTDANDTAFATYTFTPTGANPAYQPYRKAATGFPTNPAGGTVLGLGDDDFTRVTLAGGAQVKLFGVSYGSFFVGSNGYITFGEGDAAVEGSIPNHFRLPRISALFDDLDPSAGGTISIRQLGDRVVVTWQGVPQWDDNDSNSFQIEMFFDGRITMTILGIGATDGLIGLSPGGGKPAEFFESDFSAFPQPVTLTVALPASATEGDAAGTGTVTAEPIPASNLIVTLTAATPSQVTIPATVTILAGQPSANFPVQAVNDLLLDGSPSVTVTATAPGYTGIPANITVIDNETSTLTVALPASANEAAIGLMGTVTAGAIVGGPITVTLASNDLTEVTVPSSVTIPSGQSSAAFPLTFLDDEIADGTQTVTISATVAGWTPGANSIPVTDIGAPDFVTELFGNLDPNDTAGASYSFVPSTIPGRYQPSRVPATAFPTDPAGGTPIVLSDDAFSPVALTGGAQVSLFGVSYGSFFVASNGFITFGEGDTEYRENIDRHFRLPRISALFDDLDPGLSGTISVRQLGDRVAVTWQNVPQFEVSDSNSFQIEMFFDGRITITILAIGANDGLIGLSPGGGTSSQFDESDFSAYTNGVVPLPSWRALQGLASDGSQDLENPSGDGIANLLKYALNLAPNAGDLNIPRSAALANPAGTTVAELTGLPVSGIDAQGRLTFVYLRRVNPAASGIAYAVEFSDLIAPFAVNPSATTTVLGLDANWERVTVTDSVTNPGSRFAHLRVTASQ